MRCHTRKQMSELTGSPTASPVLRITIQPFQWQRTAGISHAHCACTIIRINCMHLARGKTSNYHMLINSSTYRACPSCGANRRTQAIMQHPSRTGIPYWSLAFSSVTHHHHCHSSSPEFHPECLHHCHLPCPSPSFWHHLHGMK